jgi:hypothetical protein
MGQKDKMATAEQRHARAGELLVQLETEHDVLKHSHPLDEDGIEAALIAAHPGEEAWLIRLALHLHLNSDVYLQSLSHGGPRYDLDGQPAGEVSTDARHHAHNLIKHHHSHRHKQGRKTKNPPGR